MEETVQLPELKEEFYAVMEDIKPKKIRKLEAMDHFSEPPLLSPEKYIKVELGREVSREIITVMDEEDPDEIEILEVIDTDDIDPPMLSPNYEDSRDQNGLKSDRKGLLSLCRLCATRSDGMIHMFDATEQHRNIIQKIEYCLPIVVKKNDNLSKAACQLCLAKLELSYQFYKTVTEAEKLLSVRAKTWKTLKKEPIIKTSVASDIISDNLNDLDKCRTSSLSNEHQDADSSSNALDSSTKKVPIMNVTMVNNVILSNVNNVGEERTRSSNGKRRRTDSASNALIFSNKEASITDGTVENNTISSNGNNRDKEGTRSSDNKRRKTDLASDALNSSTKETPTTDTTTKKKNISSSVQNVGEDRMQSSSNTLNLSRATSQRNRTTSHSVLYDPMCPINSDEEFRPDVEGSDSDSFFSPVSRSREAFHDSREEGVSEHHEQRSCDLSEKQLSTYIEVNTHETKRQGSNDTLQLQPHEQTYVKTEPTVGVYCCKYCGEQCSGENDLLDHMRVHIYKYPFTCSICNKAFRTRGHRNYHIVTHTREEPFPCSTCNASFASKHALRSHERAIHQKINSEGRGYRSRNKYQTSDPSLDASNCRSKAAHMTDATVQNNVISSNSNNSGEDSSNDKRQETNSSSNASNRRTTGAYMTDTTIQNNVISSNLNNLGKYSLNDKHRKTNLSSNALNLSTTSFQLGQVISKAVLNRSMPPVHSDKELGSTETLVSNEELGCNDFAPSCPLIETSHKASGDLRKEEVIKQNEKPSCNVSEERSRTQGQVNTRERRCKRSNDIQLKPQRKMSLTATLKYRCADCGKRSRTKRLMLDHIIFFHTDESLYKCSICGKRYRNRGNRERHMITHSNERPFKCNVCGARFRRKNGMERHRELHTRWDLKRSIKIK